MDTPRLAIVLLVAFTLGLSAGRAVAAIRPPAALASSCTLPGVHYNSQAQESDGSGNHAGVGVLGGTGNGIYVASEMGNGGTNVFARVASMVAESGQNYVEVGWYWTADNVPTEGGGCPHEPAQPHAFAAYQIDGAYVCTLGPGLSQFEGKYVFMKTWDTSGSGTTGQDWAYQVSTDQYDTTGSIMPFAVGTLVTNGERHGIGNYGNEDFVNLHYYSRISDAWSQFQGVGYNANNDPEFYPQCYSPIHTGVDVPGQNDC